MKRTTVHALSLSAFAIAFALISFLTTPRAHATSGASGEPGPVAVIVEPPLRDIWDRILEKYDTNRNGKIDGDEYWQMMQDLQNEEIGEPGYIQTTLAELIAWLKKLGYSPNEAENIAREIMDKYDANRDGILDPAEWKKFWEDLKRSRPGDGTGALVIPGTPIIVFIPSAHPGNPMLPGMPEA